MTLPTVYCRSIDEVNTDLAHGYCVDNDLSFQQAQPRDPLVPADAAGVIFDVNHMGLTPLEQELLVRRLFLSVLPCRVAVVSYDLEPSTIEALRDRNIIVGRRLESGLFAEMSEAIRGKRGYAA